MKLQAFSMRDTKAETFAAPFFVPNEKIAVRLLGELVLDTRSQVGKYPEDFLLYRVGEYDTNTGSMLPMNVEMICTATSCLPVKKELPLPRVYEETHNPEVYAEAV